MKNKLIKFGILGAIIVSLIFTYKMQFTTIGLVNFSDSQMAEIVKANDNHFIETIQINPKTDNFSELVDYPVIYLSHISILSATQKENIKKAMDNGSKVHVLMATSKENDFSNITGDDLKYIKDCFDNDGVENTKRWLNYSRKILDKKSLFSTAITTPKIFPKDVFYRIGTDDYFEDVNAYWSYYKAKGLYKDGQPKIVIMSANNGPQSQFRAYMDNMILEFEKRNFNVVCLAGFKKKLQNLKALQPQMVISFPHGRLAGGNASVEWLKAQNILYLTPQLVYQTEAEWLNDPQGISGGIMGQNIVVPELDGAIHPYAVAAEHINENGYHTFKPIPGRIERFCENAERWLSLKEKPNSEKKLAIYYYKGAGKNALVAGGLEVGQSIYSLMQDLKKEGYNVGDLKDFETFMKRIHIEGPILGDYALGTFEKFLEEGQPELISTQEYETWCKSELDPDSYKNVQKLYGNAPGTYLSTKKNDTSYLAIPRVLFGNIALVPVLPSALGENEFKLSHGVKKAPTHAYIASYLWARKGFNADVVAHFGAHGSVEFTPWKQLVLSLKDWPEALIAPIPHLYLYSIDNIGEAMMAKRRSYATMISHLTPPYSDSELYGELKDISEVLHKYNELQEGELKNTYKKRILKIIDSLSLDKDLELSKAEISNLDKETIDYIHHYLHEVEGEKITMGLHTLGVNQTEEEQKETVRMMAIDPIESSLEQLAKYRKTKHKHHHHHHGEAHSLEDIDPKDYRAQANFMITKIINGKATPSEMFGHDNEHALDNLYATYGDPEKTAISEYYGGSYARKKNGEKKQKKQEMVYDMKTHKMVPKSSLKTEAHNTDGHHHNNDKNHHSKDHKKNDAEKEEMVYDMKTHKMVPKSSLQPEKAISLETAKQLLIHLSAVRQTSKSIDYLQTKEGYKELSGLLDQKSFMQFKTAAKFNSDVLWKVETIENKTFVKFLKFVQDSTQKQTVFATLKDQGIQDKITSYRAKLDAITIAKASEKEKLNKALSVYKQSRRTFNKYYETTSKLELDDLKTALDFYADNKDAILEATGLKGDIAIMRNILESTTGFESLKEKQAMLHTLIQNKIRKEKSILAALLQLKNSLSDIENYQEGITLSPRLELDAFTNGMNGGFVAPSSGGDPVSNPLAVPTGKNLYSINEQVTPTKEAFETGQILAEQILQKHIARHGEYPKKIAYSLWGGEFIRNQGMNIGQIFYMLGVEPVRNSYGRVHDVKLIPIEDLKRPRIDVLVQTSGQFRDLAASRIDLINKAVQLAAEADDDDKYKNYVKAGTIKAESALKEKGFSPEDAQRFATARVFGGLNGNYGTSIMDLVEQGDLWETEKEIADTYINNMGAIYGKDNWAYFKKGMFETMMSDTEIVIHPRSSNDTGPISLDHVYEFMGGLTASIRVTTGTDPDGYFNDFRNRYNPNVQTLKEAIWTETRTNLFNPKFIKAQMAEGESAAEGFAENFRDTYGWNVMKPAAIDKEIWEGYYDIYIKDKQNLGTLKFFKETNPYALQEMTAVMLETVRKGYWQPSETVKKDIAKLHAELIKDYKAGCSGFVCDNAKLNEMIASLLDDTLNQTYQNAIDEVRTGSATEADSEEGMVLEKEVLQKDKIVSMIKENITAILLLILLIGGAITWGVIKRRRENE
ncbi:MAG: cobaltochelatase subunit CobN [Flavobacteriaceae bacterium]|nr:cobaltochelatase subunit CobN [Flavobacteriaceae bacterium]